MRERRRILREKAGVSQKALAESIGISQQSINRYENHNIEPDIRTLALIADYFNTSVDYLIGHSDVDHKIEQLQPSDLNQQELSMIEKYRKLNAPQKESIIIVMENYISK